MKTGKCKCASVLRDRVFSLGAFATLLKLLLLPARFSTDMDVHAHWKALVYHVPLAEWYTDTSSQWTLDYPILFAYFEYFLSQIASIVHPNMLVLNTRPSSTTTIRFLRASVVATDPIFIYGVFSLILALREQKADERSANPTNCCADMQADLHSAALVFFSPALVLVDNIHFQYNGLPLGVMLLSLSFFVRRNCAAGVATYASAVNLKHTLLPLAPLLAVYTLSTLYHKSLSQNRSLLSFFRSVLVVGLAFFASLLLPWLPIVYVSGKSGMHYVRSRLFPFNRGLLHAYWAPNFWALYAALDKMLITLGFAIRESDGDPASGHIGSMRPFRALPNVTPTICMQIVVAALTTVGVSVWLRKSKANREMPQLAAYSALAAFVFGWHVHEKNVLMALVPLAAAMGHERNWMVWMCFALLAMGGQFGVFPLVTGPAETAAKIVHFVTYSLYVTALAGKRVPSTMRIGLWVYFAGCCLLEVYAGVGGVHKKIFGADRMAFMPLLLVSVYSAFGVMCAFLGFLVWYKTSNGIDAVLHEER